MTYFAIIATLAMTCFGGQMQNSEQKTDESEKITEHGCPFRKK